MTIHGQLPSDPESLTATVNHGESMVPCLFLVLVSEKQSRQMFQKQLLVGGFSPPEKSWSFSNSWDD